MSTQDPTFAGLGFVPQPQVRWFAPGQLARTVVAVQLGQLFGEYADKRELQQGGVFAQGVLDHADEVDADEDFWFDYVSDLGDGFDATYSVAAAVANPVSVAAGEDRLRLPAGRLLVFGGDEVYPTPLPPPGTDALNAYEPRTVGPYATARPAAAGPVPTLLALPGNHDWYDGLSAFLRVFTQGSHIGGWTTEQRRSYFGARLPHGWWLLAIDIQLTTYIDEPQLAYFREVAAQIAEAVRTEGPQAILLCTPTPSWYGAASGELRALRQLEYFLDEVLGEVDAPVRLLLTGDAHHYARYTDPRTGQQLVTAGLGGAFTSATHTLPARLTLPRRLTERAATEAFEEPDPGGEPVEAGGEPADPGEPDPGGEPVAYLRGPVTWPAIPHSRDLASGVLTRLATRNRWFPALVGGLVAAVMLPLTVGWWGLALVVSLLYVAAGRAFADPERPAYRTRTLALGLLLGAGVAAAGVAGWAVWRAALGGLDPGGGWPRGVASAGIGALSLAVATAAAVELIAGYLFLVGRFGWANLTEMMSAQAIEDFKGFLRIRVAPDGELTVYPVGIRTAHRWQRVRPSGGTSPLLVPADGGLDPHLLEPAVTVSRAVPTKVAV